jgi:hypothetical protein
LAEECRAVLRRNHVGRLAFLNGTAVDIEPVHYVAADSWVFVRSANGTKLEAIAHNPYVAFEVDEVDGTFDWRSVVVRGTIYLMSKAGNRVDRDDFDKALAALRSFLPETLTRDDPTPFRRTIYGVHMDHVTGRIAEPGGRTPGRRPVRQRRVRAPRSRIPNGF